MSIHRPIERRDPIDGTIDRARDSIDRAIDRIDRHTRFCADSRVQIRIPASPYTLDRPIERRDSIDGAIDRSIAPSIAPSIERSVVRDSHAKTVGARARGDCLTNHDSDVGSTTTLDDGLRWRSAHADARADERRHRVARTRGETRGASDSIFDSTRRAADASSARDARAWSAWSAAEAIDSRDIV